MLAGLYLTAAILLIVEVGMLVYLMYRRATGRGGSTTEMIWTAVPALALVLIVLLTRK